MQSCRARCRPRAAAAAPPGPCSHAGPAARLGWAQQLPTQLDLEQRHRLKWQLAPAWLQEHSQAWEKEISHSMEEKGKSLEYPLSACCLRKEQAQMFSQSLQPKIHLLETPKSEGQTLHQLLLHVSSMRQRINYQTLSRIPNPKIPTL